MSERSWRRRWIQGSDGTLIELRSDKTQRRGRLAHGEVRLRPISEIKKRVTGDISKLNRRLLRASRRLQRTAKAHPAIRSVPGRIVISLFRKAVNTFEGIEILKRKRLIEEAWILLRVLLEAHVNLAYFLTHDPKEMVHRYLDSTLLDKLKHLREVNFYEGTSLAGQFNRAEWEQREAEIKGRYTDFAALRRNGFTGLPFEQRAKAVGMEEMYQYCYRIASRSVHGFDPAETALFATAFKGRREAKYDFLRSRRGSLDSSQNMLLGRLAFYLSKMVRDPLISVELMLIGVGYEKSLDGPKRSKRPGTGEQADARDSDSDEFRIWRMEMGRPQ